MTIKSPRFSIKIFADGANIEVIDRLKSNNLIEGFTTNPSLMRKAGVQDYRGFAKHAMQLVPNHPFSLEVFSDELPIMEAQARSIASWGKNIFVKIPIMNTKRIFTGPIIKALSRDGIKLNITAIMTFEQIKAVTSILKHDTPTILSVFAGRIADTGRDPVPLMAQFVNFLKNHRNIDLLWASPREVLNIFQANDVGCDIITVGEDLLNKMNLIDKDLNEFSRETVEMFYRDAISSDFKI